MMCIRVVLRTCGCRWSPEEGSDLQKLPDMGTKTKLQFVGDRDKLLGAQPPLRPLPHPTLTGPHVSQAGLEHYRTDDPGLKSQPSYFYFLNYEGVTSWLQGSNTWLMRVWESNPRLSACWAGTLPTESHP